MIQHSDMKVVPNVRSRISGAWPIAGNKNQDISSCCSDQSLSPHTALGRWDTTFPRPRFISGVHAEIMSGLISAHIIQGI